VSKTVFGSAGEVRDGATIDVVAFGKHPAWDDHIEDIGLTSATLVNCKRQLYSEGIAGNIDSGAWENLAAENRLEGFDHWFYWRTVDGWLMGRMRSSTDGKGRSAYPMIVAGMMGGVVSDSGTNDTSERTAKGVSFRLATEHVMPAVDRLSTSCAAIRTRDEVRSSVAECKSELSAIAARMSEPVTAIGGGQSPSDQQLLAELVRDPAFDIEGKKGLGLQRILYEMDRELTAFKPSASRTRIGNSGNSIPPQHLRVPRCLSGVRGVRAWAALLRQELSGSASVLIADRVGTDYLDLIVGEPSAKVLFCLRASAAALSPASLVPYSIPESSAAEANEKMTAWARGVSAAAAPGVISRSPLAVKIIAERASEAVKAGIPTSLKVGAGLVGVGLLALGIALIAPKFVGSGNDAKLKDGTDANGTTQVAKVTPTDVVTPLKTKPANGTVEKPAVIVPANPIVAPKSPQVPVIPPVIASAEPTDKSPSGKTEPGPTKVPESSETKLAGEKGKVETNPAVPNAPTPAGADPRAGWNITQSSRKLMDEIDAVEAIAKAEGATIDAAGLRARVEAVTASIGTVKAIPATAANTPTIRAGMDQADKAAAEIAGAIDTLREASRKRLAEFIAAEAKRPPVTDEGGIAAWTKIISGVDPAGGWEPAKATIARARGRFEAVGREIKTIPAIDGAGLKKLEGLESAAVLVKVQTAVKDTSAKSYISGDTAELSVLAVEMNRLNKVVPAAERLRDALVAGLIADYADDIAAVKAASEAKLSGGAEGGVAAAAIADFLRPLLESSQATAQVTIAESPEPLVAAIGAVASQQGARRELGNAVIAAAAERTRVIKWTPSKLTELKGKLSSVSSPRSKAWEELSTALNEASASGIGAAFAGGFAPDATARVAQAEWLALAAASAPGGASPARSAVEYNIKLFELKSASAEDSERAAAAFLADPVVTVAAASKAAYATGLIERLRGPNSAPTTAPASGEAGGAKVGSPAQAAAELAKSGPGAIGWACEAGDTTVVYSLPGTGNAPQALITFRPLPGAGDQTVYLSTSELSVGTAARLLSSTSKWEEFAACMSPPEKAAVDKRTGPRTWVWVNSSKTQKPGAFAGVSRFSDSSRGWLATATASNEPALYAPSIVSSVLPPTPDSPLQYISPSAAVLIARTFNCRFPTAREWAQAAAANPGSPTNRRDATWLKQNEHAKSGATRLPGLEAFAPAGTVDDGSAAVDTDDGVLWFSPVSTSAKNFENLVGNVAEYVIADSADAMNSVAATAASVTAAKLSDQLRIIGGSALSSKSIKPEEPYGLSGILTRKGMSDVGIRLAFSGPALGGTGRSLPPIPQPGAGGMPAEDGKERIKQAIIDAPFAPWQ